jgi:hypothetical protein
MQNKTLAALVVFALAFAAVPASAHGADDTFASKAHSGDWDVALNTLDFDLEFDLTTLDLDGFFMPVFVDGDNDGELDFEEPLYLIQVVDTDAATAGVQGDDGEIGEGDIRLADGSQVEIGDDDEGDDYTHIEDATNPNIDAFTFDIGFVDETGDDFTLEDKLFINIFDRNGDTDEVDTGDFNLGTLGRVTATSDDHGSPIVDLLSASPSLLALDNDGDGEWSVGDFLFLDFDDGAHNKADDDEVEILDIWLNTDMIGSKVQAGDNLDGGLTGVTALGNAWEFGFGDADGSADYDAGEPLYLVDSAECGGAEVHKDAVRLSGSNAGTFVGTSDNDYKDDLGCFGLDATDVAFADETGDGYSGSDDGIFLDLDGDSEVSVGDVNVITGEMVTASSADLDTPLVAGAFADFNFIDNDADGEFSNGDDLFLSQTAGELEEDDIELVEDAGHFVGDEIAVEYDLFVDAFADWAFAAVDEDEDGVLDPTEPVYLALAADLAGFDCSGDESIDEGFIRLVDHGDYHAGTVVVEDDDDEGDDQFVCVAGDLDVGGNAGAFVPAFAFIDETGDGYSHDDELFVNIDSGVDDDVSVGDLKLETGGRATISNSDIGAQLTAFAGAVPDAGFAWLETEDDDMLFHHEEPFYLIQDAANAAATGVNVHDVRLVAIEPLGDDHNHGGSMTETETETETGSETSSGSETTTVTATETQTATETTTASSSGDDDDKPTPGFELVALVAALGAALVLVRRRL